MSRLIFEGTGSNNAIDLFISNPNGVNFQEIDFPDGGVVNSGILGNVADTRDTSGPNLLADGGTVYLATQYNGVNSLVAVKESEGSNLNRIMNPASTHGVAQISNGSGSNSFGLDPNDLIAYNGKVYFNGDDDNPDTHLLWSVKLNDSTAHPVTGSPLDPGHMAVYDGKLYMNAEDANGGWDLYSFDSYSNAFNQVGVNLDPTEMTAATIGTFTADPFTGKSTFTGKPLVEDLFINGDASGKRGLFVYNDHGGSLTEISPLSTKDGTKDGINPQDMQSIGTQVGVYSNGPNKGDIFEQNGVVFSGEDNKSGDRGLWMSDGTSGGTKEIAKSSSFGTKDLDPYDITVAGPVVFFTGYDGGNGGNGRGLFAYVAGQSVVELIKSSQYDFGKNYDNDDKTGNFGEPTTNLNPTTLTLYDGNLYFNAAKAIQPGVYGPSQLYEYPGANGHLTAGPFAARGTSPVSLTHS